VDLGDEFFARLRGRRLAQRRQFSVLLRDRLRERAADIRDAERRQQPRECRVLLCGRDRVDEVLRGLLGKSIELLDLLRREIEQIGDVVDEPRLHERHDDLLAEPVDVHLVPRREELDRAEPLRRAADPVRAQQHDPALFARQLRIAERALRRRQECRTRPFLGDAEDLRNDLAGFLEQHAIALAEPEPRDLIPVVDRRARHGRAGDVDGIEQRDRRDRTRAADVDLEVVQDRRDLARRELVGDRPARRLRGRAERAAHREVVDLDDEAIDLVRQRIALVLPVVDVRQ